MYSMYYDLAIPSETFGVYVLVYDPSRATNMAKLLLYM